jgi:hypothetical protein
MIAVTGACLIFAWLLSAATEASLSFASALATKTNLAGVELAAVGPNLARS